MAAADTRSGLTGSCRPSGSSPGISRVGARRRSCRPRRPDSGGAKQDHRQGQARFRRPPWPAPSPTGPGPARSMKSDTPLVRQRGANGSACTKGEPKASIRKRPIGIKNLLGCKTINTRRSHPCVMIPVAHGRDRNATPAPRVARTAEAGPLGIVTSGPAAGAMMPCLVERVGFDPVNPSARFVAALVDITGLLMRPASPGSSSGDLRSRHPAP
jgi:hypothetical protein